MSSDNSASVRDERRFFDDSACVWDKKHNADNNHKLDKLIRKFGIKKGAKIIDLGCGTGIISEKLSGLAGENGKILCCDFSINMLEVARKKAGLGDFSFICADAHELPFKSNFFDCTVCFSSFPHFENKKGVLKEANRVLKNGGSLIISHLLSSREIANVHRKAGHAVSKDKMPPKDTMIRDLVRTGFKILEFQDKKGLYLLRAEKKHT
jgi:demethylmenaquinone methyltransferase/2-methoxy-6-polyprenyl-1,4-benzoquinol methylase